VLTVGHVQYSSEYVYLFHSSIMQPRPYASGMDNEISHKGAYFSTWTEHVLCKQAQSRLGDGVRGGWVGWQVGKCFSLLEYFNYYDARPF
jgi:hypothetical protein